MDLDKFIFSFTTERDKAYEHGLQCARNGLEFWANPHTSPNSNKGNADAWFAGWCYGMKELKHSEVSE